MIDRSIVSAVVSFLGVRFSDATDAWMTCYVVACVLCYVVLCRGMRVVLCRGTRVVLCRAGMDDRTKEWMDAWTDGCVDG
jgi:hypothetical protein